MPHFKCKFNLKGHSKGISSVKFSPDGRWLASSCKVHLRLLHLLNVLLLFCITYIAVDKSIKIWDADTGKLEQTLEGHEGGISDISWSHDSKYIASASDDKTIKIWDAETVRLLTFPFVFLTLFLTPISQCIALQLVGLLPQNLKGSFKLCFLCSIQSTIKSSCEWSVR
jgi:WD40 repeat protein